MSRPPKKPAAPAASSGYSDAARVAIQETTARVQEMHDAIASTTFDVLDKIPGVALGAGLVRQAHDLIAGGVYAAIHHGSGGVLGAGALLEKQLPAGEAPPGRLASGVRSALNAAFGDHLAQMGNVLAIDMALYRDDAPVALDTPALQQVYPDNRDRLCLFIHGLAFDEHCWQPAQDGELDFGQELQADFGHQPLYLRYNTGLPIAENGERLSALLHTLVGNWPVPVRELILIGHSMGGLIARQACELAATDGAAWLGATRMLLCLGSPHLGSPVERLGELTTQALKLSRVTAPLGTLGDARSQGIKDLRHGPGANPETPHAIALRFIGSTLTDDVEHPLAEWFADGLVTLGSATEHPVTGNVASARFGGIAHMGLTTDARVYGQIKDWLRA